MAQRQVAYWIKSIIGMEQRHDAKLSTQVITVEPYDYVIIGSATRMEKPLKGIYSFVKTHKQQLANRQVCYFLLCGDCDETMVLNIPGKPPHLIAGRNYLQDIQKKFPEVCPVVIGAFGGRQVMPRLQKKEALTLWLLEKNWQKRGLPGKGWTSGSRLLRNGWRCLQTRSGKNPWRLAQYERLSGSAATGRRPAREPHRWHQKKIHAQALFRT